MLFDHRKTWEFTLEGAATDCLKAFETTFSSYKPLAHGKWEVRRSGNTATATYLGRGGVHAMVAASSKTAGNESAAAGGSIVSFVAEPGADGKTTCRMWLSKHTSLYVVMIADAKFLRAYMRAVPGALKKLDPQLQIVKA